VRHVVEGRCVELGSTPDDIVVGNVSEVVAPADDAMGMLPVLLVMATEPEEPVSGEFEEETRVVRFRVNVEVRVLIGVRLVAGVGMFEFVKNIELVGDCTSLEL
jgi:hypothetical protein